MLGVQEKKDEEIDEGNDLGHPCFTISSKESWYKVKDY